MMKKAYIYYTLLLAFFCLSALIIWPSIWINLDIGSFHYHKLWKGPNLDDLTRQKLSHDFDLSLGKDFVGSTEYVLDVVLEEGEEMEEERIAQTVNLLRNRLERADFVSSLVFSTYEEGKHRIHAIVSGTQEEMSPYEMIVTGTGRLEIWGEKGESALTLEGEEPVVEEDPLRSYLKQQYSPLLQDVNNIKGFQVKGGAKEDTVLRLGLEEDVSSAFASNISQFFGTSLIGVLDDQMLFVNGTSLSEQLQLYGEPKTLEMIIMQDRKQAQVYGAMIEFGPLPVELSVAEVQSIPPQFARSALERAFIIAIGVTVALGLLYIYMFRLEGLVGSITMGAYVMLLLDVLKIAHVKLTIGSLAIVLFSLLLFGGALFARLILASQRSIKFADQLRTLFERKDVRVLIHMMAFVWVLTGVLLIWVPSGVFNAVSIMILMTGAASWIGFEAIYPASKFVISPITQQNT